jgi:hypothetical protein
MELTDQRISQAQPPKISLGRWIVPVTILREGMGIFPLTIP